MRGADSPAPKSTLSRRLASEESGQILLMTGVLMAIMLVVVALVIDIGHARLVQRQLQAGVDAAALAGAQELPDAALSQATADQYSPTPGRKNAVNTIDNATTTSVARCITAIPGCNTRFASVNAITVQSVAKVPTFFARLIGVDSLTVSAKATACFPCSVRPLDIMIVLDRTGSMCDVKLPNGKCRDLEAARDGVKVFLSMMDPKLDRVGLALTPPAVGPSVWTIDSKGKKTRNSDSPQNVCSAPTQNPFYYGFNAYSPWWQAESDSTYKNQDRGFYVVSSLSDDDIDGNPADDYIVKDANGVWDLNSSAPIVSTLNCVQSAGSTSYSMAVDEAAHELQEHGRAGVQDVIVFFADGGMNTWPNPQATGWPSSGSPWKDQPCGSAVEAAKRVPGDTAIYTIGYDLENQTAPSQRCQKPGAGGHQDNGQPAEVSQPWGNTPKEALTAMASVKENFYYTADANALRILFARVAGDILTNASRLVDNDLPDLTE